jgi:hypothetical protein
VDWLSVYEHLPLDVDEAAGRQAPSGRISSIARLDSWWDAER